ncbi:MAG: hypothetical protein PHX51_06785 [Clostridia bacterium]|nr:hypothetical protein [Clostridia bacterium]
MEYEKMLHLSKDLDNLMYQYMATIKPYQDQAAEAGLHFLDKRLHNIVAYLAIAKKDSITHIAMSVAASLKNTSRRIKHLQELGYVNRGVDPNDFRTSLIEITQKGLDYYNSHEEFNVRAILDAVNERLTDKEQDEMCRYVIQLTILLAKLDDNKK